MERDLKASRKAVNKERYFQEMEETWKLPYKYMQEKLSEVEIRDKKAVLALRENYVVKKMLLEDHPKARPFLMRLSFEVCGGGNWKKVIPACAAVEFLNISTYIVNAVFDEKGESQERKDVNQYRIAAMVFRDLATECLLETRISLSPEETKDIVGKLAEINKLVYLGQHIDLYQLNKENIGKFKSFEEMKQLYEKRAEYFCGHFMGNVAYIGAILANGTGEQIKALERFGFNYGTGVQIVNDLGDFAFDKDREFEKTFKDQYSDIRQGKLTYPIILGLEKGEKRFKRLLGKKHAGRERLAALTKHLIESGIVNETKALSKSRYNQSKKELNKLPKTDRTALLALMASMVRSNKYFVFLKKS
jgi:geranylgeranyl pyrophosphate synthase